MYYGKDDSNCYKAKNSTTFEIGQAVLVKTHTHFTFKPKYLMDYRVLNVLMIVHYYC